MRRKLPQMILLSLLIVFSSIGGCLGDDSTKDGDTMPEWEAVADDNQTYSKKGMIGTKHLIHFSASWCTPCRDVMHKVTGELPEVDYFIISTDPDDESWEKLRDWHDQVNGSNDTQDVDAPFMSNAELANKVDIKNTPTIFLIDTNGKILARHIGAPSIQEIHDLWNTV